MDKLYLGFSQHLLSTIISLLPLQEDNIIEIINKDKPTVHETLLVALWKAHIRDFPYDKDKIFEILKQDQEAMLTFLMFVVIEPNLEHLKYIHDKHLRTMYHEYIKVMKDKKGFSPYQNFASEEAVWMFRNIENVSSIDIIELMFKMLVTIVVSEETYDIKFVTTKIIEITYLLKEYMKKRQFELDMYSTEERN
jgi:hypothetical protein